MYVCNEICKGKKGRINFSALIYYIREHSDMTVSKYNWSRLNISAEFGYDYPQIAHEGLIKIQ
jgi:hypothetical protein